MKSPHITTIVLIFASLPVPVLAITNTYWRVGTENWSYNPNWTAGEPTSSFNAFINNGGTAQITQLYEYCDSLHLGENTSERGNVDMSNGELRSKAAYIGYYGTGLFLQSGGNTNLDNLSLGYQPGSSGTYGLSGNGELFVSPRTSEETEYIGYYGTGLFNQTGGVHTIHFSNLSLGHQSGSNGTYNLSDGQLTVDIDEYIGFEGTGTFTQSGGIHTVNGGGSLGLLLGTYPNSSGTYELSGNGMLSATRAYVGIYGNGNFNQTGGTHEINMTLSLCHFTGSNGTYNMTSGQLNANSIAIGGEGTATFLHTGGMVTTNGIGIDGISIDKAKYELSETGQLSNRNVIIGSVNNGKGKFVQTGGTNLIDGYLRVGKEYDTAGTYELSGNGQLSAISEYIGERGSGEFIQSGGNNTISNHLILGIYSDSSGTYTISGGELNVDTFIIGYQSASNGTFNINDAGAKITVSSKLMFGRGNAIFNAVPGATIHMTGSNFENRNTDPIKLSGLSNLTLIFEGGNTDIDLFEIAGIDMGAILAGFENNFTLGALTLGDADIGQIQLVDNRDNQPSWAGQEALYVENLTIGAGSYLDLNGYNLYYLNGSIDPGAIIIHNGGALIQIPAILTLDIKPSSCPNPLNTNTKGKGRIPMAILGTDDFDVSEINPNSITIAEVVLPQKVPSIEDVSTPVDGDDCTCQIGTDGINDLVVHFSRREVIIALDLGTVAPGTEVPITVTGELLDGTPFEATDCVTLVPRND
ncbi:MAG: hypothetical protein ACYTBZ_08135 [Planctomycetota bacterium]|jgi:hypothetical protein